MEKCSALHIGGISILYPTNPNQNSSYLGGGQNWKVNNRCNSKGKLEHRDQSGRIH